MDFVNVGLTKDSPTRMYCRGAFPRRDGQAAFEGHGRPRQDCFHGKGQQNRMGAGQVNLQSGSGIRSKEYPIN